MAEESYELMRKRLLDRNKEFSKKNWSPTSFKSFEEETAFRKWVQSQKVPFDFEDKYPDYDMRGFYRALMSGDEKATSAINPSDNKLHYPDYWKTPYHESFSNESQWATKDAPKWVGDDKAGWKLVDSKGNVYKDETVKQSKDNYEVESLDYFDSPLHPSY
jgi:hypothetical protein